MGLIDSYRKALAKQGGLEKEGDGPSLSRWFRQLPVKQKVAAVVIAASCAAVMVSTLIADYVA